MLFQFQWPGKPSKASKAGWGVVCGGGVPAQPQNGEPNPKSRRLRCRRLLPLQQQQLLAARKTEGKNKSSTVAHPKVAAGCGGS